MIRSLGLDLSATAPGLVLLGKEKGSKAISAIVAEQIPVPKADEISRWARVQLIATHVATVVEAHDPSVIVIEGYGQVSHGGVTSFIKVVEVGTLVKLWLAENGRTWREVPPSSLKKFVTGNGKASKKQVKAGVKDSWGFETKNDNIADAWGLAAFGLASIGCLSLQPHQLEALDGVKSG